MNIYIHIYTHIFCIFKELYREEYGKGFHRGSLLNVLCDKLAFNSRTLDTLFSK